jgi:PAS domain S-box-containing protein
MADLLEEQRRVSRKLAESEERYRVLFDQSRDAMMTLAPPSWKFTSANPAICVMFGVVNREAFTDLEPWRVSPERQPDGRLSMEKAQEMIEIAMREGGHSFEWVHVRLNGEHFPALVLLSRIEMAGQVFLHAAVRDISQQKHLENALRDSEAFRSRIFESSPIPIVIMDAGTLRYLDCNPAAVRIYRYLSKAEVIGKTPQDFSSPEQYGGGASSELADLYIREALVRGTVVFEWRHQRPDGEIWDAEVHLLSFSIGDRRLMQFSLLDITERKRAEMSLRENEEAYRLLAENISDIIWTMDLSGRYIYISPSVRAVRGYTAQEAKLQDFEQMMTPDSALRAREVFTAVAASVLAGQRPKTQRLILEQTCRDGGTVWTEIVANAIFDERGQFKYFMGVTRDISDRRRAEGEKEKLQALLLQAQKMESVGRLAGGVAHDFNNMLSIILGQTEQALKDLEPAHPLFRRLEQIKNTAGRSAELVSKLLAFARKQTIAPKTLDLNFVVSGMIQMFRRLIGEDIDLAWQPGQDLWPVCMDPSQVDQIMANLFVNARDAVSGSGKVTVETGNVVFAATDCTEGNDFLPGRFVMLAVSDNGCGMGPEIRDHLFEPFFTTKAVGKGTGLGLATIYGIVRQNEGFIKVYSEPGLGSTFRIYLPATLVEHRQDSEEVPKVVPLRGEETILLVEDEGDILDVMTESLTDLGYVVIAVGSAAQALREAELAPSPIHLLITDVVLPGMNGRDLAAALTTQFPAMKCLFMSGYTADIIAHHGILDSGVQFIEKPFSIQNLAVKIRKVLHEERT